MWEIIESWLVYVNKLFWIAQPYFLTDIIKRNSASLFFSLLRSQSTPFKQNRSMLKKTWLCYYIQFFFNIILNVLRPTFFNTCNLPFLHSPNIGKIRINVGPKTNYFPYFMSPCTNRIGVLITFFHWYVANQKANENVLAIFFLLNIFSIISFQLFSWKIRFPNSSNYCYKKWTTHY